MRNPLRNLSIRLPIPGLRRNRRDDVRPAPDNADTPRRHPLFGRIPDVIRGLIRPNRGRNTGGDVPAPENRDAVTTVTVAANPFTIRPFDFERNHVPVVTSNPGRNITTNVPIILITQDEAPSGTPATSVRSSNFASPRPHIGGSYLNELVVQRYLRYDPLRDTLRPNDPRPAAFNMMQPPLERYIFFQKLSAHQKTTLLGQLTQDQRIELMTAPHLAMLETLLKDGNILTRSQDLAEEPDYEEHARLVKAIYNKLVFKNAVPVEDRLTDDEQVKFLNRLHAIAPNCQAQGRGWGHVPPNAKEALDRSPGLAKEASYMVPLQTMAPANSRLIITVAPKDALSVVEEILNLAQKGDASVANTRSMKIMGPNWQGRRYDSIVVNLAGFEYEGAKALAAKLRSALPTVEWLKDGLMLDPISDGCGYGETVDSNNSVAEEHAKIFADALVEIAKDPSLSHSLVLQDKIDEHQRSLLNPALIQRD